MNQISAVGTQTSAVASAGVVSKDEFLKLLVTQLQNQDPLKPDSDTAYVAQLAQFATLEQATNQTSLLQSLGGQLSANAATQSVDLVGRTVTARFDHVAITGNGAPDLRFTLGAPAAQVTLTVRDSNNQIIRTVQGGPLAAGAQSLAWDGRGDGGQVLPAGSYKVSASARDAAGASVAINTDVSGVVTAVSFASGQPTLLFGNAQAQLGDVVEVRP